MLPYCLNCDVYTYKWLTMYNCNLLLRKMIGVWWQVVSISKLQSSGIDKQINSVPKWASDYFSMSWSKLNYIITKQWSIALLLPPACWYTGQFRWQFLLNFRYLFRYFTIYKPLDIRWVSWSIFGTCPFNSAVVAHSKVERCSRN